VSPAEGTIVDRRVVPSAPARLRPTCTYQADDLGEVWCATHGYLRDCPGTQHFANEVQE